MYRHVVRSFRQSAENVLDKTTRLLQLIEPNGNARGHIAVAANDVEPLLAALQAKRVVGAVVGELTQGEAGSIVVV